MADFTITVHGIEEALLRVGPEAIARGLRPGLLNAGQIVQAKAQHAVHSPDHPFVGKAGHSVATGKLQSSIGSMLRDNPLLTLRDVTGRGLDTQIRVGVGHRPEGMAFGRSSKTKTGRGRHANRTGGRVNKADPAVYGPIEERRHPFLVPSAEGSRGEIADVIARAIEEATKR